ncbi:MAG: LysE family translocator [Chloroflexota bacterium]|nr:LysE family translocator [Chloroflexota bacterium]
MDRGAKATGDGAVIGGLLVEGMVVGVALAAPIGPINVEIVRRGLRGGFLHGWLVGFGAVSADTIYCALVVSGIAPLADSALLRVPLYLAGAAVLAVLGMTGLRAALAGENVDTPEPEGKRSYITGFLMAALNPLGIVYWLSIGAALVASAVAREGREGAPVLVGGVFFGILCWVTVLSGMAQAGRRYVSEPILRGVGAVGSLMLLGFAAYFGVQGVMSLDHL